MKKYLKIPKRERGKGEFVFCTKCNTNVNDTCKKTRKRISTCNFGSHHHFKASYHVTGSKSTALTKLFDTRDYFDFKKRKIKFFETLDELNVTLENVQEIREQIGLVKKSKIVEQQEVNSELQKKLSIQQIKKPTSFKAVVKMYLDFMADVDVPKFKLKNYSEDYLYDLLNIFKNFATAMTEQLDIDPRKMLITDITEKEVGAFHEWLETTLNDEGEKRFGNRSYNKSMAYMRKLFRYLNNEKDYGIKDPFSEVREKETTPDPKSMSFEQFDLLIKKVTEKNGVFIKKDRGKLYKNNHYKPWMKNAFKLALETGERRDGLAHLRWSDIQFDKGIIVVRNHKVSNIQKRLVDRRIPLTSSLKKLLSTMRKNVNVKSDQFVLAPEIKTRSTVMKWMTGAFSHYWKLTGEKEEYTFKHLRTTYVTTMVGFLGEDATKVTGQTINNILKNYLDKEVILAQATSFDLRKMNKALRNKMK